MAKKKFADRNLLVLGDDIKAQIGATIMHRRLVETFIQRGAVVDRTYQLNVGGNTDFMNMKSEDRVAVNYHGFRCGSTRGVLSAALAA